MTPEQARELLRGDFASDAKQTLVGNLEANFDSFTGAHIAGTPGDFALTEAAPTLAETIAEMHYEYAAQVDHTRSDGTTWTKSSPWADTPEDAAAYSKQRKPDRIVRRLVSDPEVVE